MPALIVFDVGPNRLFKIGTTEAHSLVTSRSVASPDKQKPYFGAKNQAGV